VTREQSGPKNSAPAPVGKQFQRNITPDLAPPACDSKKPADILRACGDAAQIAVAFTTGTD